MTTYSLFPSTNGPGAPTPYAGPFLAGVAFGVTQGGMWFNAYRHWVPPGGDTVARKFALWQMTSATPTQVLVPGSVVTSGVLTAGQWNLVPLPVPVQLAIGTDYVAATGWTSVNGFPSTNNQFGTAQPFAGGIVNGPLVAWSDGTSGGTNNGPYPFPQGLFSATLGTDPSVNMPNQGSNSANFWMDVVVSTTAPAGFTGPYSLWPNKFDTNASTVPDLAVNYNVGIVVTLSAPVLISAIRYYSPPGTAQLATAAHIWSVTGVGTGIPVAGTSAPSWSGAAGSGWVTATFTPVRLPAGTYRIAVWNNAVTPDMWSAKDSTTDYWRAGFGGAGIVSGPLTAPQLSAAPLSFNYNNNPAGTPPYSDGTTEQGQSVFGQSTSAGPEPYPYLMAPVATPTPGSTQNYWVDAQFTASSGGGTGQVIPGGFRFLPFASYPQAGAAAGGMGWFPY